MCMLSEWLPMAGNWCRGLHGGIGGTSFLSQSLPLSLCHTHIGTHLHRCTQTYTLIGKHPLQDTHAHARACMHACTHARTHDLLKQESAYMHMHSEPGWLRSYAEEILSCTVPRLPVFPAEYKPLARYSPMGRKPVITNARSGVITL